MPAWCLSGGRRRGPHPVFPSLARTVQVAEPLTVNAVTVPSSPGFRGPAAAPVAGGLYSPGASTTAQPTPIRASTRWRRWPGSTGALRGGACMGGRHAKAGMSTTRDAESETAEPRLLEIPACLSGLVAAAWGQDGASGKKREQTRAMENSRWRWCAPVGARRQRRKSCTSPNRRTLPRCADPKGEFGRESREAERRNSNQE